VEQPGAKAGDKTYCLVSGVVITAGAEHRPTRMLEGKPVHFCCEACAQHFDAHLEQIAKARGISRSP
jgi:hypothetical protein